MQRVIVVALITLGLTGCAKPMIWNKPGGTQQDFATDQYGCEKDARQSGYFGGGIAGTINMQEFFKRCMVAHGYTLSQK